MMPCCFLLSKYKNTISSVKHMRTIDTMIAMQAWRMWVPSKQVISLNMVSTITSLVLRVIPPVVLLALFDRTLETLLASAVMLLVRLIV